MEHGERLELGGALADTWINGNKADAVRGVLVDDDAGGVPRSGVEAAALAMVVAINLGDYDSASGYTGYTLTGLEVANWAGRLMLEADKR